MSKLWYSIKASAEESVPAEISILDAISPWWGANAMSFLTEFRALKAKEVKVFINSPGGSVIEALTMFNGMRASGKKINVHVLGIAASAASYVAMAGDVVTMPRNTMMLPHKPGNDRGATTAPEHRAMADMLDTIENLLLPAYMARWKGTEDELKALLAKDEILTAEQCLEYGFCDEVVDEIQATASFDVDVLPPAARTMFEAAAAVRPPPPAPAPVPPLAEQIVALATAAGFEVSLASVFVTDPEASSLEQAAALIKRAGEIKALAVHAGLPERADPLIRDRKSLAEARADLALILAEADAATRVDTAQRSANLQGPACDAWSPTALWAEIRASKAGSKK